MIATASTTTSFAIVAHAIDIAHYRAKALTHAAGGFCSFEGWVREQHQGRPVLGLHYQAHPILAQQSGQMILQQLIPEFDVLSVHGVHRVGELKLGDIAVWIGVAAAHRDAAFAACRAAIDRIKLSVPIWKHERYADQTEQWRHD